MKTLFTILLLSLLAMAVSSCGHGYAMHNSGSYGYSHGYESSAYPAVYIGAPYVTYSRSYIGANSYSGGMGGGMH